MPIRQPILLLFFCSLILVALAGCSTPATETTVPEVTGAPTEEVIPTAVPQPTSAAICIGEEPNTLYALDNPNASALSVLAAIYDGPVDRNSFGYQPVILQKVPSLTDGDAVLSAVDVKKGTMVVDSGGRVVALDKGINVLPAGCKSDVCAITYDGTSPLKMDQMVVTFTILPNLLWSDGQPLTAADSVYAYELARNWSSRNPKYLVDRTQAYETVDELSVQWWGIPGFISSAYPSYFFSPLPKHAWETLGPVDLQTSELSTRNPIGWGPYVLQEWVAGDHITLAKNPGYFRAGEGLPYFDTLTFRFTPDPNVAISKLIAGECDLIDSTVRLDGQVGLLRNMESSDQLKVFSGITNVMERIDFGIKPAVYDDGYAPGAGDRPSYFDDKRLRQAVAMCIDRQKVVDTVLFGLTTVPDTFAPDAHPLFNQNVLSYPYDVVRASQLLDEAGWIDQDGNPATPRIAVAALGVPAGTPLVLNYWTTSAAQRRQVADMFTQDLAKCGIQLNIQNYTPEDFYAAGPDGVLFGRKFDLAQFAMGSAEFEPPCGWFTTSQIPGVPNIWVGANVSGFSNSEFDAVCKSATLSLPGDANYETDYDRAQYIFSDELPSIPLYWRLKVIAGRTDLCGYPVDPTALNDMWNIEKLQFGSVCTE